ncbi:uncharacterized protein BDV17DRAFT_286057 [Aspergillus undulatus]|uniref:uncharacterized protein n=1 Tax=Aspergillus undulatus TaxID=1810928 RepID=UPI003CCDA7EC
MSTINFLLRLLSRKVGKVKWQLDDTLVFLGWIFFNGFMGLTIADMKYGGVGLHQASITRTMFANWAKFLLASSLVYIYAVGFPKLAIVALYISSFSSHRPSRIICWVTLIALITSMAANTGAGFAICRPLHALWDGGILEHCFNINVWYRYGRVVNIVSDVVMLALPVPHVIRLHLDMRIKVAVLVTFLLGSVGLIASIIGFTRIATTNAVADNTWSAAQIFLWSVVEIGMYHVAACMIAYLPLARWLWFKLRPQSTGIAGAQSSNTSARCLQAPDFGENWDFGEMVTVTDVEAVASSEAGPSAREIRVESQVIVEHWERGLRQHG